MPKVLGLREQVRGGVYTSHDLDAGLRAAFADERSHERLRVAVGLLGSQAYMLEAVVRDGKVTNGVRNLINAALMVADQRGADGGRPPADREQPVPVGRRSWAAGDV